MTTPPLRGMIFDLDGTLVNTMPICVQALQETIAYYQHQDLSVAQVQALFGPTEEGILVKRLGEEQAPAAYARLLESYERLHDTCRQPFPGVEDLLARLQAAGIRTAIATGKGAETAEISLRYTGLRRWVEQVETGFRYGGDKARLIQRVLDDWGLAPQEAAYVGDVPSDMLAAEQAGVLPVGAAWADSAPFAAHAANGWQLFYNIADLSTWLGI